MKYATKVLSLFLVAFFAFALTACVQDNPQDLVNAAQSTLAITYATGDSSTSVTQDLTFPTSVDTVTVTWSSNNTAVIENDGSVTRSTSADVQVTITATLTLDDATATKTFIVTVKADTSAQDALDAAVAALETNYADTIGSDTYVVTADITLVTTIAGATVTWASSDTDFVTVEGVITRPLYSEGPQNVTMTATVSIGGLSDTVTFFVYLEALAKSDAERAAEALGRATAFPASEGITEDLEFVASALDDEGISYAVSWTTSNLDVISATGVVTQPASDASDVMVTVTASVTIGATVYTKDIEFKVLKMAAATAVSTIAEGIALGEAVYAKYVGVTVIGKFASGSFFFTDGTDIMYVYTGANDAVVGSVYDVSGLFSWYYNAPELTGTSTQPVVIAASTAAVTSTTPVAGTVSEVKDALVVPSETNKFYYTMYTVTGKVYFDSAMGNYSTYLIPTDFDASNGLWNDPETKKDWATDAIMIYYQSNMSLFAGLNGQTVTVDLIMYGWRTDKLVFYANFFGTTDDITVQIVDDTEAVNTALNSVSIPTEITAGTTLTLPSELYGVTLSYTSTNASIINPTTGVVDLSGVTGQVTVTVTATATRGSVTLTKDFVVKVGELPLSTIAEVVAAANSTTLKTQGVVYAIIQNGYYIEDASGKLFVFTNSAPSGVALGDEIVVTGARAAYNGMPQLSSPAIVETVSTGNDYAQDALSFDPAGTLVYGQTYTVTATVKVETTYNNVYLYIGGARVGVVYYKSVADSIALLKTFADTEVTFDVIYYMTGNDSGTSTTMKQFVIVFGAGAVTAATEADKVALDKDILSIQLAQVSGASATYPLVGAYGSTITWDVSAVTGATYVAETGAMTYPVVTADADYNVVATITNGTTSDTVTFVVHVRAVTDQEKLAEDQAALTLAATANEYDTIVLPATGGNGSAITWVVNTGSATLDGANLFMNLVGSAYDVTLTATLNLGTETALTKDFTIAVSPITIVTDLSTFAAGTTDGTTITWTIPNDTYVYVKGIVVGIANDGAFIQDANGNGLLLYKLKTGLAIGDEVVVYGKLAAYRSARELANGCVLKTIVSSENTVTSATVTLDQLVAFTFADAGKNITVSGLTLDHFDGDYAYLLAQGTSSSMLLKLRFNNFATWLDEVYTAGDALPEVTFVFYNIPDAATFNIDLFQIQVNESQLLGVALGSLVIPTAITEATTLTLPATFGDVALSYASNNEAVINPTTGVVDLTGLTTQVTVTLTVTATYGTSTDSATFTIKVGEYPLVDIATAISGADGDIIRTKGIITQVSGNNFWIQDTTGALYVYLGTTATFASNVVVGNEVEVIGTFKIYSTLNEVSPVESVTLVSEGNTLPTLVDVVGSDLATLTANINKLVNVSGLIIKSIPTVGTNSYTIYLTDGVNDVQLRVDKYGAEFAAINTVVAGLSVGQAVTLSGIAVGVYNNTPQLAWYEAAELATATLTDQEMADIEVLLVTMPSATVSADFTLDVAGLNSATTISWASDSAAIAITGDAATVTRPAIGEADATVTLTYTVTFGTATASDTITVTVPALVDTGTGTVATDLFISEYIEGSGTTKAIEIFNGTGVAVDLSAYTLELYTNGAASASASITLSGTLAAGDVYVIYNTTNTVIVAAGDLQNSTVINFNGNDQVVLKHNGTIIDSIGQNGFTTDFAKDVTLVRKSTISSGDTNFTDAWTTAEWDVYPIDTTTYIGSHTME